MKKFKSTLLFVALVLILVFSFVACDESATPPVFSLSIEESTNCTINKDTKQISSTLDQTATEFDINNIKYDASSFALNVYSDDKCTQTVSGNPVLKFGNNIYYLKFTSVDSTSDFSEIWTLVIRKTPTQDSIQSIEINEFKSSYVLNEKFKNGKLNVTYIDDASEIIPITINMVTGFDTTSLGEKDVVIKHFNKTINTKINVVEPEILSISVKSLKNKYFVGDRFENGTLEIIYEDQTKKTVPITNSMVQDFDTVTSGEKTIKIHYKEHVINYNIVVTDIVVSSIEIKELKTEYFVNDTFVPGKLTVKYNNETSKVIDLTANLVTGFDTTTSGTKTLTIKYDNKSITKAINVIEIAPKSLSIESLKKDYFVGDSFEEGSLKVTYNNKSTKTITITSSMVTGFSTEVAGIISITITYGDLSIKQNITVNELKATSIAIKELRDTYYVGNSFEEGKLTVNYNNKTSKDIAITSSMVSNFSTQIAGTKTITITYGDLSINKDITIIDLVPTSIAVKSLNKEYFVGDEFVTGELTVNYNDGTSSVVDLLESYVTNFNTATAGNKTISITYVDLTITYDILVKTPQITNVVIGSFKDTYVVGDEYTNGKFNVTYDNGDVKEVAITIDMVTGFTTAAPGSVQVSITYLEKEYTKIITVVPVTLESTSLNITKTTYYVSESFSGGTLTKTYNNGTTETINITSSMLTNFDTSTPTESKTATITFEGGTTTFDYIVLKNSVVSMEIEQIDNEYQVGDEFGYVNVLVTFTNGDEENFDETDLQITGFDSSTAGEKEITITFEDFSIKTKVIVYDQVEIALTSFNRQYTTYDTALLGLIKVTYSNGKEPETININEATITPAIDFTIKGIKDIAITYHGSTIHDYIVVNQAVQYPELENPAPTNVCTFNDGKQIVMNAVINNISINYPENKESIKNQFTTYFENDPLFIDLIDTFVTEINNIGLTQEQFDVFKNDIIPTLDKFMELVMYYSGDFDSDLLNIISTIFNSDYTPELLTNISKALNMISGEQLYNIFYAILDTGLSTKSAFIEYINDERIATITDPDFMKYYEKIQGFKMGNVLDGVGSKRELVYLANQLKLFVNDVVEKLNKNIDLFNDLGLLIQNVLKNENNNILTTLGTEIKVRGLSSAGVLSFICQSFSNVFTCDSDVLINVITRIAMMISDNDPMMVGMIVYPTEQILDSIYTLSEILYLTSPIDYEILGDTLIVAGDSSKTVTEKVLQYQVFAKQLMNVLHLREVVPSVSAIQKIESLFDFIYFMIGNLVGNTMGNLTYHNIYTLCMELKDVTITDDNSQQYLDKINNLFATTEPDEAKLYPTYPNIPAIVGVNKKTYGLNLFTVPVGTQNDALFDLLINNYFIILRSTDHMGPVEGLTKDDITFPQDISKVGKYNFTFVVNGLTYTVPFIVYDPNVVYNYTLSDGVGSDILTDMGMSSDRDKIKTLFVQHDMVKDNEPIYYGNFSSDEILTSALCIKIDDFDIYTTLNLTFDLQQEGNASNILVDQTKIGYSNLGFIVFDLPIVGKIYPYTFEYTVFEDYINTQGEPLNLNMNYGSMSVVYEFMDEDLNKITSNEHDKLLIKNALTEHNNNLLTAHLLTYTLPDNTSFTISYHDLLNNGQIYREDKGLRTYAINQDLLNAQDNKETYTFFITIRVMTIDDMLNDFYVYRFSYSYRQNIGQMERIYTNYIPLNATNYSLSSDLTIKSNSYNSANLYITNMEDPAQIINQFGSHIIFYQTLDTTIAGKQTLKGDLYFDYNHYNQLSAQAYVYNENEVIVTNLSMPEGKQNLNLAVTLEDINNGYPIFKQMFKNVINNYGISVKMINGTEDLINDFKANPFNYISIQKTKVMRFGAYEDTYVLMNTGNCQIITGFELNFVQEITPTTKVIMGEAKEGTFTYTNDSLVKEYVMNTYKFTNVEFIDVRGQNKIYTFEPVTSEAELQVRVEIDGQPANLDQTIRSQSSNANIAMNVIFYDYSGFENNHIKRISLQAV